MSQPLHARLAVGLVAGVAFVSGLMVGPAAAPPSGEEPAPGSVGGNAPDTDAPQAARCEQARGPGQASAVVLMAAWLTTVFDGVVLLDRERRHEFIEEHATRSARSDLEHTFDRVAAAVADRLEPPTDTADHRDPTVTWRAVPAGARVESLTDEQAVVSVWGTGVVIARGVPLVQPGWHTTHVELVWERDAWRLVSFRSEPGPQPPALGGTPQAESVGRLIERFEPLPLGSAARSTCGW